MSDLTSRPSSTNAPGAQGGCRPLLVLNANGDVIHANDAAASFWQSSADALAGESFLTLFDTKQNPSDQQPDDEFWPRVAALAAEQPYSFPAHPSAGEARSGSAPSIFITLERISGDAYAATWAPLLEDQPADFPASALTSLFADSDVGFFELDVKTGSASFTATWKRLLGYVGEELPATIEVWRGLIHPEDSAAAPDQAAKYSGSGSRAFNVELRMRHRTGKWIWVQSAGLQLLAASGEVVRVVGVQLDISDRKELEETALASNERFEFLSHSGPLGAFDLDFARQIFWVSAGWQKIIGTVSGGMNDLEKFTAALPPDEQPAGLETWIRLRSPGQTVSVTPELLVDRQGQSVPVLLGLHLTFTRKRELARAVGFICAAPPVPPMDASATSDDLVKTNRLESLSAVASGIAQEFNELLTTILGGISLARDKHELSALEESEKASLLAKGLSKQLLAFARGEPAVYNEVEPEEILQLAVKFAAAGSPAAITIEVPEGTASVRVDRLQITQVFQNLILNALQSMPGAPHVPQVHLRATNVELTAEQIPSLAAGPYVEFEVRDNGSGIAAENLQKVFEPYFTTRKHGTGLGLPTALTIVRKHGGEIGVDSTPGEGTVFNVFLPRASAPSEPESRKAPSARFRTGRILIMDDDPRVTSLTANMLQALDYKFDVARNGAEAVQLYQRYWNIGRPYDAVILDVTVVGGMGGEECFRALRDLDSEVRAIISTTYENDAMAQRFMDTGFCGFLTKPYRVAELGKVLKTVLG